MYLLIASDSFLAMKVITGAQIRMARGFLKWSAKQLAEQAGLGVATVIRMEEYDGLPNAKGANIEAVYGVLQKALKERGAELTYNDGHGPGVCLKKPVSG